MHRFYDLLWYSDYRPVGALIGLLVTVMGFWLALPCFQTIEAMPALKLWLGRLPEDPLGVVVTALGILKIWAAMARRPRWLRLAVCLTVAAYLAMVMVSFAFGNLAAIGVTWYCIISLASGWVYVRVLLEVPRRG